jgi:hypothetical protein
MASQVLSGSANVSYTNNTGQNVRVVINYMANPTSMIWGSASNAPPRASAFPGSVLAIGRNLAFSSGVYSTTGFGGATVAISANNMVLIDSSSVPRELDNAALPTELMLASGHGFSASCGAYNIVIIPEAG